MCDISRGCTLCSELVWAAAGKVSNLVFILPQLKQLIPLQIYFLGNQAAKWNGTTGVDQWVHAAMPSLNIGDFLSSSSFIHWYQEMMEKSEHNSISLMSCTPFPVFQLSVNKSWGTGFPTKMIYVSDETIHHIQHYKESGSYRCCFLSQKILISSSSFHSWKWELTGNWKNSNETHGGSISSTCLRFLWAFLNKKSAFAC